MSLIGAIRSTAWLSDYLFRHAFPLYEILYERYKRIAERDLIACITRNVHNGDRVADVGANIGFYSALLAERVGPAGAVYAFEPAPVNFRRLADRTRRYAQVHALAACVAEQNGTGELFLSPNLHVDHRSYPCDEARRSIPVSAVALDRFFAAGEQLQFVKMDVQGAEYAALCGMQKVLTRSRDVRLLFELWPYAHDRFGVGTRALLTLLEGWGFHVHRLDSGGVPGERLTPDTPIADADKEHCYFEVLCFNPEAGRA
jgi:FkbM family methyltransferase